MKSLQSKDSGLFYKLIVILVSLSLKARPVEKYRGKKKHRLSPDSVIWDTFEFFSFFVLSVCLITFLSSVVRT